MSTSAEIRRRAALRERTGASARPARVEPKLDLDVLLVDADGPRARTLAAALSGLGLATQVADSFDEGVARASTANVLLVRRRLGDSDAFAFLRAARKKSPLALRTLILADAPSVEDALRAIDATALGIAFEPHDPAVLVRRIRKAMEVDSEELIDTTDAQVFRVRRSGVVFKMKAKPELLVEYMLQATEALAPPALGAGRLAAEEETDAAALDSAGIPVEHRTGPFLVVRDDRKVLFANKAARALLSLPEDLSRARFEEPLDVRRVVEKKMKSGRRSLDVVIRTRNMVFEGEQALGVSLRDVTELRNLESQLRLSNEILDRVPALVLVADSEGRVAYAGPGVRSLLGYEPEDAMGEGFWTLAWPSPEEAERLRVKFRNSAHAGTAAFEARLLARDGSAKMLAFQFAPGPGGMLIAVGQDVTALKDAESESTRARQSAEAATVAKSDFLANMSHEIRTPMNAVIGMTALLLETDLDSQQRDYAEIIQKSGEALISLISDILDFSKIEAGKFELDRHRCSVEGLLEQCLDLLAGRAAEKGLDLAGYLDSTAAIEFLGDGTRIRQILVNLVANAVKFTESGGVMVDIKVVTEPAQPRREARTEMLMSVTDTGIGIPEAKRDRLFKAFSQIDASTTRRYGGTGLGLAISAQLAEMMGGRILVESTPGRGSTFTLALPVEPIAKIEHPYLRTDTQWLEGKRIMVCATGSMTGDVISRLVTRWGGTCVRTAITEASDRLIRGEHFDLAIIDHSRNLDARAAAVSETALKALKDRCIEKRVPVISLRPVASRNMVATQGVSLATAMTPVKAAGLYQAVQRAMFGGRHATGAEIARVHHESLSRSALSVLVAEDNLVNQKVARLTLQSLGFTVVDVVSNGRQVLETMKARPYDIVFLDLQMPEMDGLETARAIRQAGVMPRPWLVALTASALAGDRERCMSAGMDDYLAKPLQRDALITAVDKARSSIVGQTASQRRSAALPRPEPTKAGSESAPPGGSPSPASAIIDGRALARLRGLGLPAGASGSDLVTELVDSFLKEVPDKLTRISKALVEQDYLKAHRFAHSLISTAGNLGAVGVVKAARTLESVLRLKSREESEQAYVALEREFALAETELAKERQT